jgi:Ca2+-binding RTX toxin-like protein
LLVTVLLTGTFMIPSVYSQTILFQDDTLKGSGGDDRILGGSGADILKGNNGEDML